MELSSAQKKIKTACIENLNLKNASLSEEYYYDSIVFCLIDAIFSIGVKYTGVSKVVINYCTNYGLNRLHPEGSAPSDKHTINGFLGNIKPYSETDYGADEIYNNRWKTSTNKNGSLKSKAVYDAAIVLQKHGINTLSDIRICPDIIALEKDFLAVKGQGSGISFSYFLMLAGDNNHMKIDRWLTRFVEDATGKTNISIEQADRDLKAVCADLAKHDFPQLTPRLLDHEIWKYAKENL